MDLTTHLHPHTSFGNMNLGDGIQAVRLIPGSAYHPGVNVLGSPRMELFTSSMFIVIMLLSLIVTKYNTLYRKRN
jgi:hypothetical protein